MKSLLLLSVLLTCGIAPTWGSTPVLIQNLKTGQDQNAGAAGPGGGSASAAKYAPEHGNRLKINLGNTAWKFTDQDPPHAKKPVEVSYEDATWQTIGIPHSFCADTTYVNFTAGRSWRVAATTSGWYRKHFNLDTCYQGRKILVEFEGVNIAAAVYINGHFIPGNSQVPNKEATHVNGFIGFVVDITAFVNFGAQENVLSVRVANRQTDWYVFPLVTAFFRRCA